MKLPLPRFHLVAMLGLSLLAMPALVRGQDRFSDDVTKTAPPARVPPPGSNPPASIPPGRTANPGQRTLPQGSAAGVADPRFAKVALVEAQDFGVAATSQLRGEPMHAPTPTQLEGGRVIATAALQAMYERDAGKFLVFDVLGGREALPNAQNAQPAGRGGTFMDATQGEFGAYLGKVTNGNKEMPLVFYCLNVHCWMSYNAALRAVRLGYTQVYWYRGGIEAWQQANLPTQARQF